MQKNLSELGHSKKQEKKNRKVREEGKRTIKMSEKVIKDHSTTT